jgi:hypothetical protein
MCTVVTVTYRVCGYINKCSVNMITNPNPICSHTFIWHMIHIHTNVPKIQWFVNYCPETKDLVEMPSCFMTPPPPPFTCTLTLLQPSHVFFEDQLHQNVSVSYIGVLVASVFYSSHKFSWPSCYYYRQEAEKCVGAGLLFFFNLMTLCDTGLLVKI